MSSIVKSEVNAVVSNKKVLSFVERYRLSVKKTAESILELANVVFSAKTELSKDEFKKFRIEIDADSSKDSYIKKLCVIASNAARFEPIKDKLPASYTTLYSLANIEQSKFDEILEKNIISTKMTALDLTKCFKNQVAMRSNSVNAKKTLHCVTFNLDIRNIEKSTVTKVIHEIAEVCKMFNVHYECDSSPSIAKQSEDTQDVEFEERLAA
jgi:hypothetical protein